MKYAKFLAAGSIIATLSLPAFAASWQPYEGHDASKPRAIFAQEDGGVATLLSCNASGELSAIVSFKSGDFVEKMKANAPYRRTIDVQMKRKGEDEGKSPWTLIPAVNTLHTKTHTEAAKIYNATILQETVALDIPREGSVELVLPQIDDTFTAFANACSPGSKD